jgi:hypothetical protein
MSQLSDAAETDFINHQFRTATWAKPTVNAFALYTAAPGEAGGGTEVANAGNYARATLNPLDANWAAVVSGNGQTNNLAAITYGVPSAAWGLITHMGLHDSATYGGGTLRVYAPLTAPKNVNNGDPAPSFPIGAFVFTIQ